MTETQQMQAASFSVLEADPETGLPGIYFVVAIPGRPRMLAMVTPHSAQELAKALLVASIVVGNELGIDLNKPERMQ